MCVLGRVSDLTAGCSGRSKARVLVALGWGGCGYSEEPGAGVSGYSCCILGCPEWNGCVILMYTVVTSRLWGCYLSEPRAAVEIHGIGLSLTELCRVCEPCLNVLLGFGGLTGDHPRIHTQFAFC